MNKQRLINLLNETKIKLTGNLSEREYLKEYISMVYLEQEIERNSK